MKNQICRQAKIIIVQILILIIWGVVMLAQRENYQQNLHEGDDIRLSKGMYDIVVEYTGAKGDKSWILPKVSEAEEKYLKLNPLGLAGETNHVKEKIWVSHNIESLSFAFVEGEDECEVKSITIKRDYGDIILAMGFVFVIFTLGDILYFGYSKLGECNRENFRRVVFGLGIIIAATSVPLMVDYMMDGADLVFHLSRIEGLSRGLLSGEFPVRIQPQWLYGKGYATSVYYSDLFLIIPAVLKIIGMPFIDCYKVYVFMINSITIIVAYYSFKKIFKDMRWGFLGAVLYGMAPYRLYNIYARAAVGEYTAMMFLPLIMLGLYEIYHKASAEKCNGWLPLVIGLSGIINSHILTCEMVAVVIVLVCLFAFRYTFRRDIFVELAKTVIIVVALNLWFLLPFLQYMIQADLWVNHMAAMTMIQKRGIYLAHYFLTTLFAGRTSDCSINGMIDGEPTTVGVVLFSGFVCFVCKRFCKGNCGEKNNKSFASMLLAISVVLMAMTLNIFPWDSLQKANEVFEKLISSLQFPFRLLSPLTVILVGLTIIVCICFEKKTTQRCVYAILICAQFVSASFMLDDFIYSRGYVKIHNANNMGTISVGGGEYIPAKMKWKDAIKFVDVQSSEYVILTNYEKNNLRITFCAEEVAGKEGVIDLPLCYYPGYEAWDQNNGVHFEVMESDGGLVRIIVPADYSGMAIVDFNPPWYWRMAEMISLSMFIGILAYESKKWLIRDGRKRER